MSDPTIVLETLVGEVDAGRRAALCVVIAVRGSAPQVPGALLCVKDDAGISGTVGGGATEAEVCRRAGELLPAGTSGLLTFNLVHDHEHDEGPICGGQMDVAVRVVSGPTDALAFRAAAEKLRAAEPATLPLRIATPNGVVEYRIQLEAPPKLVIAGAGHVGQALARLMVTLGFRVSVIDDRPGFANARHFPAPIEPVVGNIADTLRTWPFDANSYVTILTRGHKYDEDALAAVLAARARYIGMIGSRRKIAAVYENLRRRGMAAAQLERVHAPIGLDIGAITPEEIAVSIAAELIATRRAGYRGTVEGPFPAGEDAARRA